MEAFLSSASVTTAVAVIKALSKQDWTDENGLIAPHYLLSQKADMFMLLTLLTCFSVETLTKETDAYRAPIDLFLERDRPDVDALLLKKSLETSTSSREEYRKHRM